MSNQLLLYAMIGGMKCMRDSTEGAVTTGMASAASADAPRARAVLLARVRRATRCVVRLQRMGRTRIDRAPSRA